VRAAPPAIGNGHGPYPGAISTGNPIDIAAAERAVADLLAAIGVPPGSETASGTPRRVAAALAELLTPPAFDFTVFPNTGGQRDLVIARRVPFTSLCAHHLLPFAGTACVAYLPGGQLAGLSKLARVVRAAAAGLRTQEEMGQQIASLLEESLGCPGAGVLLAAEHCCVTARGARAHGSDTVTLALRGELRDNPALRAEFLALAAPCPP
jgi:GTP cyclohydrolase IA